MGYGSNGSGVSVMSGTVGGTVGGIAVGSCKVGVGDRMRVGEAVGGGPKVGACVLGNTVIGKGVMLGTTPPSGVLVGVGDGTPGARVVTVMAGVGVRCCGAVPHRKIPTQ
jgi:hypothetical protein